MVDECCRLSEQVLCEFKGPKSWGSVRQRPPPMWSRDDCRDGRPNSRHDCRRNGRRGGRRQALRKAFHKRSGGFGGLGSPLPK